VTERLDDLVAAAAATRPDHPAVVDGDRVLTYGELEQRSAALAAQLVALGVAPGDRVGLYLDKSAEALVGIYGVLRAGAAYVPLDPDAPPARLAVVARDCGLRVLLTAARKAEHWDEIAGASADVRAVVVLGDAGRDLPPTAGGAPVQVAAVAAVAATSAVGHRNALAFVDWAVAELGVTPDDRLSSHAPLHFDLSIFDVFAAARAGATLVLVPASASVFPVVLARFIAENAISVWYSVPSILTALALRGGLRAGDLPLLRTVLFAGEVFPTKYLRQLMEQLPRARFYNLYGPTETNVCTFYPVTPLPPDQEEPIPIGRPIAGVDVFIATEAGTEAGPGEVGELLVQGPTVTQGYWNDPARTAAVLGPLPTADAQGPPAYRTGDLVRRRADGELLFVGRRDAQIKSRGYRIELGDIEAAINAHPAVIECAVVPVPDDLVTNRIKAFVAARSDLRDTDLLKFCADRIPRYMVPETFEFRESLAKTSTGKIDRQQLTQGRTS
jgi:amino acid adenylation domain-containing protein